MLPGTLCDATKRDSHKVPVRVERVKGQRALIHTIDEDGLKVYRSRWADLNTLTKTGEPEVRGGSPVLSQSRVGEYGVCVITTTHTYNLPLSAL